MILIAKYCSVSKDVYPQFFVHELRCKKKWSLIFHWAWWNVYYFLWEMFIYRLDCYVCDKGRRYSQIYNSNFFVGNWSWKYRMLCFGHVARRHILLYSRNWKGKLNLNGHFPRCEMEPMMVDNSRNTHCKNFKRFLLILRYPFCKSLITLPFIRLLAKCYDVSLSRLAVGLTNKYKW